MVVSFERKADVKDSYSNVFIRRTYFYENFAKQVQRSEVATA
ncbi:hypothetical protein C7425_11299 [Pantoea ananatis]|nr:hypothetical protein C7425_11299 [Pantoea ananatis]PWV93244.1 hypothetical protein C7426_101765 [Pantoea ananatis]REC89213.1 hypothetical protein C7423_11385 [Pantoea ananatis]